MQNMCMPKYFSFFVSDMNGQALYPMDSFMYSWVMSHVLLAHFLLFVDVSKPLIQFFYFCYEDACREGESSKSSLAKN